MTYYDEKASQHIKDGIVDCDAADVDNYKMNG